MQAGLRLAPWEALPWRTVKSVVLRLQLLIFRAAVANDAAKVRAFQQRLLLNSHAKLLAVKRVTDANQGEASIGVNTLITGEARIALARTLNVTDKALPFFVTRKRRLGGCLQDVVRDRAKQMLVKLALEPEWEARFESGSFGYRPGRSYRDALDAITLSLKKKEKYVLVVHSCYIFQEMEHRAVLSKLRHCLPSLVTQIEAWLNGGIMGLRWLNPGLPRAGDYGVISPLLVNIAMHGLETALKRWAAKMYPNQPAPLLVRYCEQFVLLNRSLEFIQEATKFIRRWLLGVGIRLDPDRYTISDTRKGFEFLGFTFEHWGGGRSDRLKTIVEPSHSSCKLFLSEVRTVIKQSRGASPYNLIQRLRPKIERFGNYFVYSDCHDVFRRLDSMIYQKLRPWVFRRRRGIGRYRAKLMHYPSDRIWNFQGRDHQSDWVLADIGTDRKKPVFLPHLRWFGQPHDSFERTVEEVMLNVAIPDGGRRHRVTQLDTLVELWTMENIVNLDDQGLEQFVEVMELGNHKLWRAITGQDGPESIYVYDNPVFIHMKRDISKKLKELFPELENGDVKALQALPTLQEQSRQVENI